MPGMTEEGAAQLNPLRSDHMLVDLDLGECERLLANAQIGRIGFSTAGRPVVLPVNFRFVDGEIVFRTARGQKLDAVASNKLVAFEVDDFDVRSRGGWSVLVTGTATEIEEWEAFEKATKLGLFPWAETPNQDRLVRIVPQRITGKKIR